jgi:hypothetical protein
LEERPLAYHDVIAINAEISRFLEGQIRRWFRNTDPSVGGLIKLRVGNITCDDCRWRQRIEFIAVFSHGARVIFWVGIPFELFDGVRGQHRIRQGDVVPGACELWAEEQRERRFAERRRCVHQMMERMEPGAEEAYRWLRLREEEDRRDEGIRGQPIRGRHYEMMVLDDTIDLRPVVDIPAPLDMGWFISMREMAEHLLQVSPAFAEGERARNAVRYAETSRQRAEAHDRSIQLLKSHLSPAQRTEFEAHGFFHVIGSDSKTRYRIYSQVNAYNVFALSRHGTPKAALCFEPTAGFRRVDRGRRLPQGDKLLTQKVYLENCEAEVRRVANFAEV